MSVMFIEPGTILFSGAGQIAMDPACCCGLLTCTLCDSGDAPNFVDIAMYDNENNSWAGCNKCPNVNYILFTLPLQTDDPDDTYCEYMLNAPPSPCDTATWSEMTLRAYLKTELSGSPLIEYIVWDVWITVGRLPPLTVGSYNVGAYKWISTITPPGTIDCFAPRVLPSYSRAGGSGNVCKGAVAVGYCELTPHN